MIAPTAEWIRGLPKAEIHVHLEGCLSPEVVATATKWGGERIEPSALPQYADLRALLEFLDWSCSLIDTAELVEHVACDAAARIDASGTRCIDMIYNPTHRPVWEQRLDDFAARRRTPTLRPCRRARTEQIPMITVMKVLPSME